jgi:two-component system sensor histidine kinase PilS (NtrC family)
MTGHRIKLLQMIILRGVALAFLLVAAVIIQTYTTSLMPLAALYVLILAYILLSLVYLALYLWAPGYTYTFQAHLQTFFDLILITVLVYISGGLQGSLHILYILVIISSSYLLTTRAANLMAALSAILFGLLIEGLYYHLLPNFLPEQDVKLTFGSILFSLIVSWALFFAVALLLNSLNARLRRMRDELQRAQKALEVKESQALAGRISAQIAHEIRNPLTAIAGAVQVLGRETDLNPERRELMRIVLKETDRVSQTLEQFMDLVNPHQVEFETIDLAIILQETLYMLSQSGELNGRIHMDGNYASRAVPFYGNGNQFKQIFWNLIKNAIQAMPEGGRLEVDFSQPSADRLTIRFSDTGVGMNEEARQKLFEPFFSGFESGRGLGMAVVRRVVDDYQGRIEVNSALHQGTEVLIDLPIWAAPSSKPR